LKEYLLLDIFNQSDSSKLELEFEG